MKAVKKTPGRWALSPKRKARAYGPSLSVLGVYWDQDLRAWCVRSLEDGRRVTAWVTEHEARYPHLAV